MRNVVAHVREASSESEILHEAQPHREIERRKAHHSDHRYGAAATHTDKRVVERGLGTYRLDTNVGAASVGTIHDGVAGLRDIHRGGAAFLCELQAIDR